MRSVEPSSTQMTRLMYRLRSRISDLRAMHGSSLKAGTIASIDPMFRLARQAQQPLGSDTAPR